MGTVYSEHTARRMCSGVELEMREKWSPKCQNDVEVAVHSGKVQVPPGAAVVIVGVVVLGVPGDPEQPVHSPAEALGRGGGIDAS